MVSGNGNTGILIFNDPGSVGVSGANVLQGNKIGLTPSGDAPLPNAADGLLISGAPRNVVSGAAPGVGNAIGGNTGNGIEILGAGSSGTLIQGNRIGTDGDPNHDVGNRLAGIYIVGASGNLIGGTAAGAGNVISGDGGDGVLVKSQSSLDPSGNNLL